MQEPIIVLELRSRPLGQTSLAGVTLATVTCLTCIRSDGVNARPRWSELRLVITFV